MACTTTRLLVLAKGRERYAFRYNTQTRVEVLRAFCRCASNPELSFTWYDAAVLTRVIRRGTPLPAGGGRFRCWYGA